MNLEHLSALAAALPDGERELANLMISACEAAGNDFYPVFVDSSSVLLEPVDKRTCYAFAMVKPVDFDGMKSLVLILERAYNGEPAHATLLLAAEENAYSDRNILVADMEGFRVRSYGSRVRLLNERTIFSTASGIKVSQPFMDFLHTLWSTYEGDMQERFKGVREALLEKLDKAAREKRAETFDYIKEVASKIL